MAYRDLQEFITALDDAGELIRVREPVSVMLEITEVADRVMKSPGGGQALLFERPLLPGGIASAFPLAINLFGSAQRMAMALGVESVEVHASRIAELLSPQVPKGVVETVQAIPRLAQLLKVPPRSYRGRPPCQDVSVEGEAVDIGLLPVQHCWPKDAGRFITYPMVLTRDPETGIQNVGLYRMQLLGPRAAIMHWQRHKGGAAHFRRYRERGERRMPVVVALGCDPATMYAQSAPLPPGIDEFLFSGFLARQPVMTFESADGLKVPAHAEIVLEGYVDPSEPLALEGPFGDHTAFYTTADFFPVFHVQRLTHRERAVYPSTIVGLPPMEDYYLGNATERIFLPLLRLTMPEIVDYHMPPEGIFHNLVFVSIRKEYPGQAWKVMNGLWGQGLLALAKVIIVLDRDVNVQDPIEAWCIALNNIDPERDVRFTLGPADDLDHAARGPAYGSKMGIDATRKWPEEGFTREWPERIAMDAAVKARVDEMWGRLGIP